MKIIDENDIKTLSQREQALFVLGGIAVLERVLKAIDSETLQSELRALVRDLRP